MVVADLFKGMWKKGKKGKHLNSCYVLHTNMFIKEFICGKCKAKIVMAEKHKGKPFIKNPCKCGIHHWQEVI